MQIFSSDLSSKEECAKRVDKPYDVLVNGEVTFQSCQRLPPFAREPVDRLYASDFNDMPLPKSCSIIMNGHYNILSEHLNRSKDDGGDEEKPFVDQHEMSNSRCSSSQISDFLPTTVSGSTIVSGNLKESSLVNSGDSDSEGDPEISRHLLKDDGSDAEDNLPKYTRAMPKLSTFRSSPKKFTDPHSHIQHRPLGRFTSSPGTIASPSPSSGKWNWTVVKLICVVLFMSFVAALSCIIVGLFLTGPVPCVNAPFWWHTAVIYEIFVASFQDTGGDGFGDFRGVTERLDYLKNMSFDVVRLNSIFSALDYPLEYEHVIDHNNVDPHLGNMEDFKELVSSVHDKGMRILIDINPTVTSDQHTWAAHWLLHRPGRYENFYVNYTDAEGEPPWELDREYMDRGGRPNPHRTFGGHLYLNWSNPVVQFEMIQVLEFWLQMGIDGFYFKHLENIKLDDPREILLTIHRWKYVMEKYSANSTTKIMVVPLKTLEAIQTICGPKLFVPIPGFFNLVDAIVDFSANRTLEVSDKIWKTRKWIVKFPSPPWLAWHFGSAETPRLASRVGAKYQMNCLFLLSLLPGSISVFYGDELGLKESYDDVSNKIYRGGQLVPMQWTATENANFTTWTVHPWLPIYPEQQLNVQSLSQKLNVLSGLLGFRKVSLHPPPQTRSTTMMRTVLNKLQGAEPEAPNYRWFHDAETSLLALEVTFDSSHRFAMFANFGNQDLKMEGVGSRQNGMHKWNEIEFYKMKILFSTNPLKTTNVNDVVLESGHAIINVYS